MQSSARMRIDAEHDKSRLTPLRSQSKLDSFRKKQWAIRPTDDRSAELAKSLKISPVLAQLLINREITDTQSASEFLRPKLTQLIDPAQMPAMATMTWTVLQASQSSGRF